MNHTEQGTVAVGAPNSAMRYIMTPIEPETPKRAYNVSTNTPWGTAQSAEYYGPGIVFYSTAGHGGIHVSAGMLKRIPEYLQTADQYADGRYGWYEEDCGWAIVCVCIPERFPVKMREAAIDTMRSTYSEQWARFCQEVR